MANKLYELSYTNRDGRRVRGQLYTAEFLSKIVSDLEGWGATDIVIRDNCSMWLAIGYTNKDNYYAIADTEAGARAALLTSATRRMIDPFNTSDEFMNEIFEAGWEVTEIQVGAGKLI